MKTFGKHLRPIVVLMLALVMFCTTVFTTAFALESNVQNEQALAKEETKETATLPDNTGEGETITGWLDITYGEGGITVTLTPDVAAIKGISKDEIKTLVATLVNAVKTVVVGDIVKEFTSSGESLTSEDFVEEALNIYVDKNYGGDTMAFFEALIENKWGLPEEQFVEYVCDLLSNSIKLGVIDEKALPSESEIEIKISEFVQNKLNSYIDSYIDNNISTLIDKVLEEHVDVLMGKYLNELFGETVTYNGEVENLLRDKMQTSVAQYVKNHAFNYLDNGMGEKPTAVDQIIANYIKVQIEKNLVGTAEDPGLIDDYINGTMTDSDDLYTFITARLQAYIEGHFFAAGYEAEIQKYIAYKKNNASGNAIYDEVTNDINGMLISWIGEVVAYNKDETPYSQNNKIAEILINEYNPAVLEAAWNDPDQKQVIIDKMWEELLEDDALFTEIVATDLKGFWAKHKDDHGFIKTYAGNLWNGEQHDKLLEEIENMILDSNTCKHAIIDSLFIDDNGDLKVDYTIDHLKKMLASLEDGDKALIRQEIEDVFNDAVEDAIAEIKNVIANPEGDDPNGYRDIINGFINDIKVIISDPNALDPNGYGKVINSFIDDYCNEKFGMSYDALFARIDEFTDAFVAGYLAALKDTEPLSLRGLLELIRSIKVGKHGEEIYEIYGSQTTGVTALHIESIKKLIKTLPTPNDILKMSPEEMLLSYDFEVVTEFGTSDFNMSLVVHEDAYKYVHRAAQVIVDHVDFSVSADGEIFLDVKMPAIFTAAVLKACETGTIPEDLKDKVFTAISKNPDDAYAMFMNLEFDDVITLLERIDFAQILNKDSFEKYIHLVDKYIDRVDLENLTNEELIAKLSEYAGHFNTLKNYVAKIYSRVPDAVKTKEIADFYDGNGKFSVDVDVHNVNVKDIVTKFVSGYNAELAEYLSLLVDVDSISFAADISVSFADIYSVEFYKPGVATPYRTGFLPTGADLKTFADLTEIDGNTVIGWVDVELNEDGSVASVGKLLTEMPKADTKVMALTATGVIDPESVVVAYKPGVSYDITAGIEANVDAIEIENLYFAYSWYKDGNLMAEATSSTISVSEIADNGQYYCVITVKASVDGEELVLGSYTTKTATVRIVPEDDVDIADITLNDIQLLLNSFVYDGQVKTVVLNTSGDAYVTITIINGESATNAGKYTATIKIDVIDKENTVLRVDGAQIPEQCYTFTREWTIEKQRVDITLDALSGKDGLVYSGNEYTVNFGVTVPEIYKDLVSFEQSGNKNANAGTYTAAIKFTLANTDNYVYYVTFGGVEYEIENEREFTEAWSIAKKRVDLTVGGLTTNDTLIYNGKVQTVNFDFTVPAEYSSIINFTQEGNAFTDAGSYFAKIILSFSDVDNYAFFVTYNGNTAEVSVNTAEYTAAWTIAKAPVYVTHDLKIDGTFVYNAAEQTVEFSGGFRFDEALKDLLNITEITGNVGKNARLYTASKSISLTEDAKKNYVLIVEGMTYESGTYTYSEDWEIEKFKINYLSLTITKQQAVELFLLRAAATNDTTYNGSAHTYVLDLGQIPGAADALTVDYEGNTATNAGNYNLQANITLNDTENYEIVDEEGNALVDENGDPTTAVTYESDWSISPYVISASDIEALLSFGDTLEFNGEAQFPNLIIDNRLVENGLTVVYTKDKKTNVGTYEVIVYVTLSDASNYTLLNDAGRPINMHIVSLTWSITPKEVKPSDVALELNQNSFEYNGSLINVVLKGAAPEGMKIDFVEGTSATNVGTFYAKVKFTALNGNYTLVDEEGNVIESYDYKGELKWEITPKPINVDELVFELDFVNGGLVYNGAEQAVTLKPYSYEGITVVITGDKGTDAGNYAVTVTVTALNGNYTLVDEEGNVIDTYKSELKWEIAPKPINVDELVFELDFVNGSLIYNGTEQAVTLKPYSYEGITVTYTGENGTDAGNYEVTVTVVALNGNYKLLDKDGNPVPTATKTLDWNIKPLELSVDEVALKDAVFTYTGSEQKIELVGLHAALKATLVSDFANTAVGNYKAEVKFSLADGVNASNYVFTETTKYYDWEIAKIQIDLGGVSFVDKAVNYDGFDKFILLTGTLPAGVELVRYENNVQYKVGEYKVFAVITLTDFAHYEFNLDTVVGNYEIDEDGNLVYAATFSIQKNPKFFAMKDSEGNVIVSVNVTNGVPEEHVLAYSDISYAYDYCDFSDALQIKYFGKVAEILYALDINFVKDGDKRDVKDEFTVRMRIPEAYKNNDNLILLYINDDGVAEYEVPFIIDNGYIEFKTTHFSTYALAEAVDAPAEDEGKFPWWIILIAVIVVALIIVIIILKKKPGKSGKPAEPTDITPEITEEVETETEETLVEEVPTPEMAEEVIEEQAAESEPVEEAPVEQAPVEEAPVEEAPAEEAPVEQAPVEEVPAEEAPVEQAPVEEVPAEEAPVEQAPEILIAIAPEGKGDEDESIGQRIINGEVVLVSYRSSYMSRLIQADSEIQDYYTVIKNTLLSYKGVKSRVSWNFESFNKGRIQCAKLNLKGRSLLVYIGLNPEEYNINKYHFVDVSDKPKFEKVPMLMKVKSDRGLKYVLELIEEMMSKNEIPQGEMPNEDYHMPYETTEELVKRDLVKVILPPGVTLDENTNIEKLDVGELIDSANMNKTSDDAQTTEEAPAAEEAPMVQEIHVDAVHADELLTDEEATEKIEVIKRTTIAKSSKMAEVNLDVICDNYEDGETVELAGLQAKRIVNKNAGRLKVLARGVMTKRLTVVADKFSLQAVKMITLAGGTAEQLK